MPPGVSTIFLLSISLFIRNCTTNPFFPRVSESAHAFRSLYHCLLESALKELHHAPFLSRGSESAHASRPVPILVDWAQLEADCGDTTRARDLFVEASRKAQDSHMPLYQAWAAFEMRFGSPEAARRLREAQLAIEAAHASQHADPLQHGARLAASTTEHVLAALNE